MNIKNTIITWIAWLTIWSWWLVADECKQLTYTEENSTNIKISTVLLDDKWIWTFNDYEFTVKWNVVKIIQKDNEYVLENNITNHNLEWDCEIIK